MFSVKFFDPTVMTDSSFAQEASKVSERIRTSFDISMRSLQRVGRRGLERPLDGAFSLTVYFAYFFRLRRPYGHPVLCE